MRIIEVAGPSHREDGAPGYILDALKRVPGVVCERRTVLDPSDTWGDYDAVIEVDWAADAFPQLPEFVPEERKPSLLWNSDTHWSSKAYLYRRDHSRKFRHVLCAQQDAVASFSKEDPPMASLWMPHAAPHTVYTPRLKWEDLRHRVDLPPDPAAFAPLVVRRAPLHDWCFVGHMNGDKRIAMLGDLCDEFKGFCVHAGIFFEEVANLYTESKIVFNISVCGDLNMRTFEVCATRSFLLTDHQLGMEDAGFVHGQTCAIYESREQAMNLMDYYLSHDDERERIAEAGYQLVLSRHTYWHRARQMLQLLGVP